MSKDNDETSLGNRLKDYEKEYERYVNYNQHIIVRLDGHKFSKFTKGFKRPFDIILHNAMVETTKDLIEEFNAVTGYTQSDEITLVIPMNFMVRDNTVINQQIFKGRVLKIASLASAFCTMRFNNHLAKQIDIATADEKEYWSNAFHASKEEDAFDAKCATYYSKVGKAWFDARVYGVQDDAEAFNSVMWRVRDCVKNARSMFSQHYVSHKELQGLNGLQQTAKALENGHNFDEMPDCFKYGTLVKKQKYLKVTNIVDLGVAQLEDFVERTRIITLSKQMTTFSEDEVKFVMDKTIY